jgi:hypothetical protein
MPPPIIRWTRLEPYTRSKALEGGLRAAVHDPLWMLGRQWQLGELRGEDAGSPVKVSLRMDCTPLTRYLPQGFASQTRGETPAESAVPEVQRIDPTVPLEMIVEREAVRRPGAFAPKLAAEAGLQFQRYLTQHKVGTLPSDIIAKFRMIEVPKAGAPPDVDTMRFVAVMASRVPDGALLATVLRVVEQPAAMAAFTGPDKDRVVDALAAWQGWTGALAVADQPGLAAAVAAWRGWYDTLFAEPDSAAAGSWIPERMEYQFAVAAPTPDGEVVFSSPEYSDGDLDWYSFDVAPGSSLKASRADLSEADRRREMVHRTVLPTPAEYPGMPVSRYWEFEDARVDFGAIGVGAQELAHLLLIEFAMIAGDDWYVIPVDMPVGSAASVRWLVVTDTFGERTLIHSARHVDRETAARSTTPKADPRRTTAAWDMFRVAQDRRSGSDAPAPADLFLLAPTVGTSLQGGVLEDVLLLRDEMANMAWAVERLVESPLGRPIDRAEAFHRGRQPVITAEGRGVTKPPARRVYRLVTDVPDHWLPLYPTRNQPAGGVATAAIGLWRGGTPSGRILEPDRNLLIIAEEEVPRAGARVTRAFQSARTSDGRTLLWVGRRKGTGRGEGSSGIRFDVLEADRDTQPGH